MFEQILTFILTHLSEILGAVAVALLGFLIQAVKRLPALFLDFAKKLEEQAALTPGAADDAAAKVLVAIAQAINEAYEHHFSKPKVARRPDQRRGR